MNSVIVRWYLLHFRFGHNCCSILMVHCFRANLQITLLQFLPFSKGSHRTPFYVYPPHRLSWCPNSGAYKPARNTQLFGSEKKRLKTSSIIFIDLVYTLV